MQIMAIAAPLFAILTIMLMVLLFTKLGKINIYAYFTGIASLITSIAYFLRGVFKIGQHYPDLIYNWTAFLMWLAIAVIFFMVGLPSRSSKES